MAHVDTDVLMSEQYQTHASVEIAAPPERVYQWWVDPEKALPNTATIVSRQSDNEYIVTHSGKTMRQVYTLLSSNPPFSSAFKVENSLTKAQIAIELRPTDEGTIVQEAITQTPTRRINRLELRVGRGHQQRWQQANLIQLKELIEGVPATEYESLHLAPRYMTSDRAVRTKDQSLKSAWKSASQYQRAMAANRVITATAASQPDAAILTVALARSTVNFSRTSVPLFAVVECFLIWATLNTVLDDRIFAAVLPASLALLIAFDAARYPRLIKRARASLLINEEFLQFVDGVDTAITDLCDEDIQKRLVALDSLRNVNCLGPLNMRIEVALEKMSKANPDLQEAALEALAHRRALAAAAIST